MPLRLRQELPEMVTRPRTAIDRLLAWCCPSAVVRRVRSVVVDAIDRVSFWAWSHIGKELRKVINPLRTDRNPARAVVGIVLVVWSQASLLHSLPRAVFAGHVAVAGVAVNQSAGGATLNHAATATRRGSGLQIDGVGRGLTSAVASTKPVDPAALVRRSTKHGQASEFSSSQVFCCWSHHERIARLCLLA
jgi:hypothetical protein